MRYSLVYFLTFVFSKLLFFLFFFWNVEIFYVILKRPDETDIDFSFH